MMDNFMRLNPLMVTPELKEAIDQIYNYPMREQIKYTLGQMLRRSDNAEYFAEYLSEMYKANQLCIVDEDNECKEARVICSMGLKNEIV